ncbi:hypothetical protein BY996DRAFT_6419749 [Phakopsora pachyrhizi]|nr:hypothetical protein BY996DRAFT_6419749 [Phakopsora pachyrhizi]
MAKKVFLKPIRGPEPPRIPRPNTGPNPDAYSRSFWDLMNAGTLPEDNLVIISESPDIPDVSEEVQHETEKVPSPVFENDRDSDSSSTDSDEEVERELTSSFRNYRTQIAESTSSKEFDKSASSPRPKELFSTPSPQSIPNSISQPESPNDLTRKHQSEVASEKSHLSTKSPHGSSELSTIHADGIAAIDARITTRPKFSPVSDYLSLTADSPSPKRVSGQTESLGSPLSGIELESKTKRKRNSDEKLEEISEKKRKINSPESLPQLPTPGFSKSLVSTSAPSANTSSTDKKAGPKKAQLPENSILPSGVEGSRTLVTARAPGRGRGRGRGRGINAGQIERAASGKVLNKPEAALTRTGPSRACKAAARGRGGPAQANSGTRVTIQSEPVLPNPVPSKAKRVVQRGKGKETTGVRDSNERAYFLINQDQPMGQKVKYRKLYRPAKFSPLSDFLGEKSLDTSSTSIDANKSSGEASASVKKLTKSNQRCDMCGKNVIHLKKHIDRMHNNINKNRQRKIKPSNK